MVTHQALARARAAWQVIRVHWVFVIVITAWGVLPQPAAAIGNTQDPTFIEDFERTAPLHRWRIVADGGRTSAGQPLSRGTLAVAEGSASAAGAVLHYDIVCAETCGHFVAASSPLASPVPIGLQSALSLWVRMPAGVNLVLRVRDSAGQTVQYRPSVEAGVSGWQRVVVPLLPAQEYWGGDRNGRLRGAITEIGVLADTGGQRAARGSLAFDQLRLIDPDPGVVLDDFDAEPQRGTWRIVPDGATRDYVEGGWALRTDGHAGNGAELRYAFRCASADVCGRYVEAVWRPADGRALPATSGSVLSFRVRSAPEVKVTVRVLDGSGQTLQYHPEAFTLETFGEARWQHVAVPLTQATQHWGGAINDGALHDGVRGISILVENRFKQPAAGGLLLDDVRLLSAMPDTVNVDLGATLTRPVPSAVSLKRRLGVSVHFLQHGKALRAIRTAGFDFIRTDLSWARVEKNGQYDFTPFDALRAAAAEQQLGMLWILDYGHPDHGGATPLRAEDIAAFARYAEAAARRYAGTNVRYEIWNEPDFNSAWRGNVAGYLALVKATIAALRRGDPHASITTGGLAELNLGFLNQMLSSESVKGVNAIGIHPYRLSGPETAAPDVAVLQGLVKRALGEGAQLWNTEWGYSSAGFFSAATYGDGRDARAWKRQAVLAVRETLTAWALGLPVNVWYDVMDDGADASNREHNFGLLDAQGDDKPAMRAVRTLTTLGRDLSFAGFLPDLPHGLHAMRLEGTTHAVFVLWCDQPGARFKLQFLKKGLTAALDMYGRSLPVADVGLQHAAVSLSEADGPVYVRVER